MFYNDLRKYKMRIKMRNLKVLKNSKIDKLNKFRHKFNNINNQLKK